MDRKIILHLEAKKYSKKSLALLSKSFVLKTPNIKSQKTLNELLNKSRYNYIFTRLGLNLNSTNLKNQTNLKCIVTPTTGLNHIDMDYLKSKNIDVISLKDESDFLKQITSTAEHTWALLLNIIRKINNTSQYVKQGYWTRENLSIDELYGKKIGIIGFGRLGKIVSGYAKAFKMDVVVFDKNPKAYKNIDSAFLIAPNIEDLVRVSDIISLHIPYNLSNNNFFNKKLFDLMKTNSYFINTSRGEVIDENYMLKVLSKKLIKGAAVDVLKNDSIWTNKISKSNKVLVHIKDFDNLLVTPHIGGYGIRSVSLTRDFITKKFLKIIT